MQSLKAQTSLKICLSKALKSKSFASLCFTVPVWKLLTFLTKIGSFTFSLLSFSFSTKLYEEICYLWFRVTSRINPPKELFKLKPLSVGLSTHPAVSRGKSESLNLFFPLSIVFTKTLELVFILLKIFNDFYSVN